MGNVLTIKQIDYGTDSQGRQTTIFTDIFKTNNYDVIEKLQDMGRKNWYLDSECGAEFELQGYELNEIKENILEFEDDSLIGVDDYFYNEDWYRCSLSF